MGASRNRRRAISWHEKIADESESLRPRSWQIFRNFNKTRPKWTAAAGTTARLSPSYPGRPGRWTARAVFS